MTTPGVGAAPGTASLGAAALGGSVTNDGLTANAPPAWASGTGSPSPYHAAGCAWETWITMASRWSRSAQILGASVPVGRPNSVLFHNVFKITTSEWLRPWRAVKSKFTNQMNGCVIGAP